MSIPCWTLPEALVSLWQPHSYREKQWTWFLTGRCQDAKTDKDRHSGKMALGFPRVIREIWRHQKFYGISSLPALNLRLTRLGRKLQGVKQKPPIRSWLVIIQGRCPCVFISPCSSTSSWPFHEREVPWIARPASSELAEKQLMVLPHLLQNHIHR